MNKSLNITQEQSAPKCVTVEPEHSSVNSNSQDANVHLGSSLDDFLIEDGIYEESYNAAVKRVIIWQIKEAMQEKNISKQAMAEQMNTSRASLARLLDPENDAVTLKTLGKAAEVLGKKLSIELV